MKLSFANLPSSLGPHLARVAVAAGIAFVAAASYVFAFYYIQTASASATLAENDAVSEQIKNQKLEALSRVLKVSGNDITRLDDYIVTPDSAITLIDRIENMAAQAGITVDIGQAKADSSLSFTLTTNGSYSNTRYFLLLLEALPLNIKFGDSSLDLEAGKGSNWHGTFALQILSFMNNG